MKGAKSSRSQNDRNRKTNKRSEKSAKLDRKSSRGMIYENEELRLRTININAEVERGQSDIKRLRRENEQLRREIWTLRDECDRLNKRFKAKLNEHDFGGCRGSGGSGRRCSGAGRGSAGCDGNSDDSDSCDTCRCEEDRHCSDECCQDNSCSASKAALALEQQPSAPTVDNNASQKADNQPIHFDHLSVVSEETLSNPEMLLAQHPEHLIICTPDPNGSQSTLPSLVGPLTPLTPIELVANQLNDLQAMVPPLSYFENILQQHMGSNMAVTPAAERGTSSSTTTGRTMKHTNGWDYNLQSPFSQRKYSNPSSPSRSPPPPQLAPTLTTFVPTSTLQAMPKIAVNAPSTPLAGSHIETIAITTNATQLGLNSPKHFFAPIKPRLKLNTKLANQDQDALPPGSPPPPLETAVPLREPPDIFVNNALASPYQRPAGPRHSPQVSPRHRARSHCQLHHQACHAHVSHQQRPRHCQQQQPQLPAPLQHCSLHRAVVNVAAAVGLGVGAAEENVCAGSVVDLYTAALAAAAAASAKATTAAKSASAPPSPLPPSRSAEPVYATAQKSCHRACISATALTKPVMTVTTNSTKTTMSPLHQPQQATTCAASCQPIPLAVAATGGVQPVSQQQTDSVNLESILNDIETISEDILAIQLEKSKSRDNLISPSRNFNGSVKDSAKKPYRSEMNLYLQYDGTNPSSCNDHTATTATAATNSTASISSNSGNKLSSRTRSLEREHTDSPAPHMPDPMAPFPDKCTYLGFEQLNQTAGAQQSPTGQKPPVGVKPCVPAKPPPPLPPARRPAMPTEPPPLPPVGLSPNKSHLYKSLASAAAAKRAIFRSSPTPLTRSLDMECTANGAHERGEAEGDTNEEEEETARRKARRVSIVCADEQTAASAIAVTTAPTTTASCGDLASAAATVLAHPGLKAFKQISHSTPSSPHSSRRRTNSNTMTAGHADVAATASAPPSYTHHPHHRKEGSDPAPMTATVSRPKCSRRHSEGTVHNVHRISNSSGATAGGGGGGSGSGSGNGGGGHHHHHTHHHQHSGLISSNPHHSHHSHQDSNHETVTSLSDRNSNSFASSRESSTSFSIRSNRRKISISSHTGGKIPWCGCWGNGCL